MNGRHPDIGVEKLKQQQIEHQKKNLGNKPNISYEGNVFHDFFRAIPFARTAALLDREGVNLNGKKVLVTSCGTGIDVYYLRKYYPDAIFTVCDLSEIAVKVAATALHVEGSTEDTENLSYIDQQFDYSFVAASLHHLPRPWIGLYEMIRVSRYGAIVIEPNDSLLTRFATALGLATEVEPSGNYVFRVGNREVKKIAKSLFYRCATSRYFATHRVANSYPEFLLLKVLNHLSNVIASTQGNYISFTILKSAGQQRP